MVDRKPTDYWFRPVIYLYYLSALMFSSSILRFLAFEFPKKHWLLTCAMSMDDVMNKVRVCIK